MPVRGCAASHTALFSRPRRYGFTWQDGVMLAWAGLRGAVGLVLALFVLNSPGERVILD